MAYIRKRGSKWYYTIEIGDGANRKRKEVPGGSTRQEAEAAYARALVSLEVNGGYVERTKKTVAEFFTEWLSDDVSINTHKNTSRSYRSIFENHIRPAIGDRKLRSIRPQMLQQLLNDAKQNGLARSTVSSICAVLKKAFVYASDFCECIPKNPAQNIKVPKYTAPPKEIKTFTAKHLATIFRQFPAGHQFFLPPRSLLSYGRTAWRVLRPHMARCRLRCTGNRYSENGHCRRRRGNPKRSQDFPQPQNNPLR